MRLELTAYQKHAMCAAVRLPRCPASGKVSFRCEADARDARGRKSARLRIYHCPHCRGWHMTKGIKPFD